MNFQVDNPKQLQKAAERLLSFVGKQKVFLFFGEMGAGKTTFIKAICHALGLNEPVTSPTFSIVNQYELADGSIYHFDFYRLKSQEEAFDIGFEEYLYSENYCFIEWPEKIKDLWPAEFVSVKIEIINQTSRMIVAEITN
jgi:tRNA threonylcarbamoyladenosine biosynthesis protein TsaE